MSEGPIETLNDADADELRRHLLSLTASPAWADELIAGRPYPDVDELLMRSDESMRALPVEQIDAALAGHPRIGEKATGLDAQSAARSAREQAGMDDADDVQSDRLAAANTAYEKRFGRIYLVAAAGLQPDELIEKAESRLHNDDDEELDVVRGELARITRLRLGEWLVGTSGPS